jgi:hypothetical protein
MKKTPLSRLIVNLTWPGIKPGMLIPLSLNPFAFLNDLPVFIVLTVDVRWYIGFLFPASRPDFRVSLRVVFNVSQTHV